MTVTFKFKRGTGSDPSASDMVVGEPVLRTDTAELFFKKDDNSVAKVSGGGGGPDFKYLDLRNAANNGAASYPGNDFTLVTSGTTTAISPAAANTLLVSYGGVIQKPNSGTSTSGITGFIIDGSRFKTATNLAAAPDFILYQESGGIGEPSDGTVTEAKLSVSNNPTNGYFLQAQSGNTGGLTWAVPATVGGATGVDFNDNVKALFGTGSDLEIYHDGSNSWLKDTGTGNLNVASSAFAVKNAAANENMLATAENGNVELFYDNSKKLDTNSGGVKIHGNLDVDDNNKLRVGTSSDLQIYHDGTNSHLNNATGYLVVGTDSYALKDQSLNEFYIKALKDGGVELYYDNSKKAETTSSGFDVTGTLTTSVLTTDGTVTFSSTSDNVNFTGASSHALWIPASNAFRFNDNTKALFGTGNDLEIYHDGSDSYIKDSGTGILVLQTNQFRVNNAAGNETIINAAENGTVDFYHDNSIKCYTTATGFKIHTSCHLHMDDSSEARFGSSDDLKIYTNGSASYIAHNGDGDLFISTGGAGENLYVSSAEHVILRTAASENAVYCIKNGAVDLYYDNSKKLETLSGGARVYGNLLLDGDSRTLKFGNSDDLQIYHDGNNSYISDTGTGSLILRTGRVSFNDTGNNEMGRFDGEGLKFNGDSAAANGLDDYEIGSWDPTPNTSNPSWLNTDGTYVKIGRLVHCDMWLRASGTSSSSSQIVCSLPFVATNDGNSNARPTTAVGRAYNLQNWGSNGNPFAWVSSNSSNLNWMWNNNGANPGEISMNVWKSGAELHASITYRTN